MKTWRLSLFIFLLSCSTAVQKRLEKAGEALVGLSDEEKAATINIINTTGSEAVDIAEDAVKIRKAVITGASDTIQSKIKKESDKIQTKLNTTCHERVGLEYKEVKCPNEPR